MKFISDLQSGLKKKKLSFNKKISKIKSDLSKTKQSIAKTKPAKEPKPLKVTKLLKEPDEEVTLATKVKIISAIMVVSLASYVAYWVQEPTDIKIDVLDGDPSISEELATGEPFPTLAEVSIVDFTFTPANLTVEAGTTVVWTNTDLVAHTVTAEDFSSGSLEAGESYNYMFEEEGVYEYECSFHPQMTGKIIVTAGEEGAVIEEDIYYDDYPFDDIATDEVSTGENIAEGYFSSLEDSESGIDSFMETLEKNIEKAAVAKAEKEAAEKESASLEETGGLIVFSADDIMTDTESLRGAATVVTDSDELATTGPEDFIYIGLFATILYFNRRKIASALR